jgi:hypothetical protein
LAQAELLTGGGKEFGAISRTAVGEDALDLDAMSLIELDSLVESGEEALGLLVWKEGGESETAVVVDGDVEALDAGAWMRCVRSPVARTPGRAKRPNFLMSRWRRSPGWVRS